MGILKKLFGEDDETTDEKELREYEEYYPPTSGVADSTYSEFVVSDIFVIKDRGTVAAGTVTAGTFSVGDTVEIICEQGNITTTIVAIEQFRKMRNTVSEGANAGFLLRGIDKKALHRNDIIKKVNKE